MVQRDKHLSPAALLLAHVILDDAVPAGEPVFLPQPIRNPLGCVTLLTGARISALERQATAPEPPRRAPDHRCREVRPRQWYRRPGTRECGCRPRRCGSAGRGC